MNEEKKIQIIKLKNRYLYNIGYIYSEEKYKMNGKALEKTFKSEWYVSNDEPKLLQRINKEKINEKWELINKELYNETIPLIIDSHTKEKYNALTQSDLYKYSYDTQEVLEEIKLNVISCIEINEDVPFEYEELIKTRDGWYSENKTEYLIQRIEFSIVDNCLTPSPIKELTKPCVLPKKILYEILTDYIKRNINRNIAQITSDFSFCIRIEDVRNNKKILEWENDYDKRYTLKDLTANDFTELVQKLDKMKKDVIDYINNGNVCECCKGTGFISKPLDLAKYW